MTDRTIVSIAACMAAAGLAGVVLLRSRPLQGFLAGTMVGAVLSASFFTGLLSRLTIGHIQYYSETSALYRSSGPLDLA